MTDDMVSTSVSCGHPEKRVMVRHFFFLCVCVPIFFYFVLSFYNLGFKNLDTALFYLGTALS